MAALVAGVSLVGAPGAHAALTATAAVSPTTVSYYGPNDLRNTRELEYSLVVTTGSQAERFRISSPGVPEVAGPAQVSVSPARSASSSIALFPLEHCERTDHAQSAMIDARLPANSTTTFTLRQLLDLGRPPAEPVRYKVRWALEPWALADNKNGLDTIVVVSPLPAFEGIVRTTLNLFVGLTGTGRPSDGFLTVNRGTSVTLSGYLSPAGPGDVVSLLVAPPGSHGAKLLGHARLDSRGRFLFRRWHPAITGEYAVWARYRKQRFGLTASRSPCGSVSVTVR